MTLCCEHNNHLAYLLKSINYFEVYSAAFPIYDQGIFIFASGQHWIYVLSTH